jgi:hypothetical protein
MKKSLKSSNMQLAFEKLIMNQPTLKADILNYTSGFYPKLVVYLIGFGTISLATAVFIVGLHSGLFFSTMTGSLLASGLSCLWHIKRSRQSNSRLYKQANIVRDDLVRSFHSNNLDSIDLESAYSYLGSFWMEVMVDIATRLVMGLSLMLLWQTPVYVGFGYTVGCIPAMVIKYYQYRIAKRNENDIRVFNFEQKQQFESAKLLIQLPPSKDNQN